MWDISTAALSSMPWAISSFLTKIIHNAAHQHQEIAVLPVADDVAEDVMLENGEVQRDAKAQAVLFQDLDRLPGSGDGRDLVDDVGVIRRKNIPEGRLKKADLVDHGLGVAGVDLCGIGLDAYKSVFPLAGLVNGADLPGDIADGINPAPADLLLGGNARVLFLYFRDDLRPLFREVLAEKVDFGGVAGDEAAPRRNDHS